MAAKNGEIAPTVRENALLKRALDNMAHGLCMFDSENILLVCNRSYLAMYGLSPEVVKPGISIRELLAHSIAVGNHKGRSVEEVYEALAKDLLVQRSWTFHNVLDNGRTIAVSVEPLPAGGWVATHEDITDRQAAEAQIAFLARHDPLTGLPNRLVFREKLQEGLSRSARGEKIAVFCLDLDRFKAVNDTLGHSCGDELLREAAQRLQDCVRDTDTVARVGGDEFTIVQTGAEQPSGAGVLAERVIEKLSADYEIDGQLVSIGVSIGVSIAPDDSTEPEQAMRNADLALYRAKSDGRGQCRFFASDMDERMQARRGLELDLRRALANEEFDLAFQPIVSSESGRITAFEALLRWNHPERGLIMPDLFVPLAEETGLIVGIGDWVLRHACASAAAWPDDVSIAVNISPAQFRAGKLVQSVAKAVAASGLDPARLELEITEGILLADSGKTLAVLHALRRLGVRIAMDDFGTGYSSLSYLRSFPFCKIKIDRSFIRDIFSDSESLAIVRAVTELGRSLGMETTAEGVETEEQLAQIRSEGCSEVQGFLLGRPMSRGDAARLLVDWRPEARAA